MVQQQPYSVIFNSFTERHFIRSFQKKYRSKWLQTQQDIIFTCQHIDNVLKTSRASIISASDRSQLVKLYFTIRGSRVSPKSAGNRCILLVDNAIRRVSVLLVYSKNDISTHNETQQWKSIIKQQYPDVAQFFSL